MEELFKAMMQQAAALKKKPDSVPWKPDEPWAQPCYLLNYETDDWDPIQPPVPRGLDQVSAEDVTTLALYTWNIDAMLPFPKARMEAAMDHLGELVEQLLSSANTAVIINLQECIPSDLVTIGEQQWVRERFYMTDIDDSAWASGAYGTTTLVDRRLEITSCFRLHYSMTQMERDALFVDVTIRSPSGPSKSLRLCNTHLESLIPVPPLRPSQMKLIAEYMHADGVLGAIVSGDFNAIQPEDESLHTDNNLKDAYLELGGQEHNAEGYTWGQQAHPTLRERFGCSRMDKVFFCGGGLRLVSFERFGTDVVVCESDKDQRDQILSLGFEKPWVTDHLGLNAVFSLTNNSHF